MSWLTQWSTHHYAAVDKEDQDGEDGQTIHDTLLAETAKIKYRRPYALMDRPRISAGILVVVIFTSTILLTVRATVWYLSKQMQPVSYSPLREMMEIRYEETYLRSGHLANESSPDHIYRLPDSPAVRDAWYQLYDVGVFPLTRSEVVRLGKDPNIAVKAPEFWGWPKDSYMGSIEATHQLHCLDTLRRNLLPNYHNYWGSRFGFKPNVVWEYHIMHCLDMLRQHLMCTADTSVYTYHFVKGQHVPFGDFGIRKKCVNFDSILDFNRKAKENWHKSMNGNYEIPRPADVVEVPPLPNIPQITDETEWKIEDGAKVPVGPIRGLEDRDYCLGDVK